jgi:hypothetical protein
VDLPNRAQKLKVWSADQFERTAATVPERFFLEKSEKRLREAQRAGFISGHVRGTSRASPGGERGSRRCVRFSGISLAAPISISHGLVAHAKPEAVAPRVASFPKSILERSTRPLASFPFDDRRCDGHALDLVEQRLETPDRRARRVNCDDTGKQLFGMNAQDGGMRREILSYT